MSTDTLAVRLVDYAKQHLVVVPINVVGGLIARGAVAVNGRVGQISALVHATDTITVDREELAACAFAPQDLALVIHYEDDDLLVCAKPPGMHVHPLGPHRDGTLLNGLLWHCGARPDQPWGRWRPRPLHRLDRAASGLIAIAKHPAIHDAVRRQLAAGAIERRYRALVNGLVAADVGTIDAPLGRDPSCDYRRAIVAVEAGGQRAVTHWTCIARGAGRSLLELVLETGRTHQIRAHLASIGHPIVGDALYAMGGNRSAAAHAIALHASELRVRLPGRDEVIATSPIVGLDTCYRR